MTTLPNEHDSRTISPSHGSAEPKGRRLARSNGAYRTNIHTPDSTARVSEFFSDRVPQRRTVHSQFRKPVNRPLRIMKFGGTSVGDASCIARVIDIIRAASRDSDVVVVVSAMSGVTNKLVEAAVQSEMGGHATATAVFEDLEVQHELAAQALISSLAERDHLRQMTRAVLRQGDDLCRDASLSRALPLRTRDAISSLGERLSAPLVAAALTEYGVPSKAIDATELIVTNSSFGGAEPQMDLTRERCEARIPPLLHKGFIPVVTGFIGATVDGELTTLGRGGSDYSATILGAALEAEEVVIWTDVDGVLTSDPCLVPGVCTIPEISYREAAELAHFGAKVLHPKTLRPLMQSDIPLWIRNTFAPEKPGTKITPEGSSNNGMVKALTALSDAALISVGGPAMAKVPNVLARTFTATAAARAEVLLILQSYSQNEVRFVVPSALAKDAVETLRREFAQNLANETDEHITLDTTIGIVTVVGQNLRHLSTVIGRTFDALDRENVNVIAIAQGSSECNVSFVVERKDLKTALVSTHREFQLGAIESEELPANV
jgi:bifunctional aspartokinase / homoserine dehydrogenase 1